MKLDESLGFLLNKAAGEMKFALETALRPYDLTPGQWSVLARLKQNDGQKISELGRSLFFDRPTMSGIIRRLDTKALILKVPDPQDQRAYRIHISAKGVELMNELPVLAQDINARALNGFTSEEADYLKGYLRRVLRNMSK